MNRISSDLTENSNLISINLSSVYIMSFEDFDL